MAFKSENGAEGLTKRLRERFVTFGVPEELTSDGGPQYTAGKIQAFHKSWGVHHRVSSVVNPHANCRAEVAVKSVKRIMMDNTAGNGSLEIRQISTRHPCLQELDRSRDRSVACNDSLWAPHP